MFILTSSSLLPGSDSVAFLNQQLDGLYHPLGKKKKRCMYLFHIYVWNKYIYMEQNSNSKVEIKTQSPKSSFINILKLCNNEHFK